MRSKRHCCNVLLGLHQDPWFGWWKSWTEPTFLSRFLHRKDGLRVVHHHVEQLIAHEQYHAKIKKGLYRTTWAAEWKKSSILGLIRIKCIRGILRFTVDSSSITSVINCEIFRVRWFEMQHYEARSALNLFAPLSLADIEGACPNWAIHWAGQRVPSRLGVSVT